jgi:hypothetical protein
LTGGLLAGLLPVGLGGGLLLMEVRRRMLDGIRCDRDGLASLDPPRHQPSSAPSPESCGRSPDRATRADRRSPRRTGDLRSSLRRGQETHAERLSFNRDPEGSARGGHERALPSGHRRKNSRENRIMWLAYSLQGFRCHADIFRQCPVGRG